MKSVQAAGCSDIGKVRQANEDCFLINQPVGLYVVADGMGGHQAGEVASRIAIEIIGGYIADAVSQPTGNGTPGTTTDRSEAADLLCESISLANRAIYTQSTADAACRGMGTTVSALYLANKSIVTANVGDSPIYLLRNGEIENLYTPHTLFHESNRMSESMASRIPRDKHAHVLTRAVGIRSEVGVDFVETPCFPDDIIVLCTDGLSGKLSREEIRDMVYRNDSEAACQKLTDLANQRGGEDNITVIVVRITSGDWKSGKGRFRWISGIPAWITSFFSIRKRF